MFSYLVEKARRSRDVRSVLGRHPHRGQNRQCRRPDRPPTAPKPGGPTSKTKNSFCQKRFFFRFSVLRSWFLGLLFFPGCTLFPRKKQRFFASRIKDFFPILSDPVIFHWLEEPKGTRYHVTGKNLAIFLPLCAEKTCAVYFLPGNTTWQVCCSWDLTTFLSRMSIGGALTTLFSQEIF